MGKIYYDIQIRELSILRKEKLNSLEERKFPQCLFIFFDAMICINLGQCFRFLRSWPVFVHFSFDVRMVTTLNL